MRYLVLLLLVIGNRAFATVRYVAASAGTFTGGSACNGQTAITPTSFNALSLAAGDTTYICGTITATANTTLLQIFNRNGSAGNLISLIFDTGAVLSSPYWSSTGAIYIANDTYVLVDGGTNGTIATTANGTGLANNCTGSAAPCTAKGVFLQNVSNSTVRNLTVSNTYVHLCSLPLSSCTDDDVNNKTAGISWTIGSNVTINNNTVNDAFVGISYTFPASATSSTVNVFNNTVDHCNWDIEVASGAVDAILNGSLIYGNVYHDWLNWGSDNNNYHHDGIFVFIELSGAEITGLQIYNNLGYGQLDAISGYIYLEDNGGAQGQLGILGAYVFNNVFYNTFADAAGNGTIFDYAIGSYIFNNTIVQTTGDSGSLNGYTRYPTPTTPTLANNIITTCGLGFLVATGATFTNSDYNDIYGCNNFGSYHATTEATLANWQSGTGLDAHSIATNPNLNPSSSPPYQLTNSSSPAYRTGTNLTSYCGTVPALCIDANGVARPSSGPWDMGAYHLSPPVTAPAWTMFAWNR